jgi:hypothetical protein
MRQATFASCLDCPVLTLSPLSVRVLDPDSVAVLFPVWLDVDWSLLLPVVEPL